MERRRSPGPFIEKRDPSGARDRRTPAKAIYRKTWDVVGISRHYSPQHEAAAVVRTYLRVLIESQRAQSEGLPDERGPASV